MSDEDGDCGDEIPEKEPWPTGPEGVKATTVLAVDVDGVTPYVILNVGEDQVELSLEGAAALIAAASGALEMAKMLLEKCEIN